MDEAADKDPLKDLDLELVKVRIFPLSPRLAYYVYPILSVLQNSWVGTLCKEQTGLATEKIPRTLSVILNMARIY